jgi:NhaA family Na+:H+ antiporter
VEKRTAESEQSGLRRGRLSAAFDDFAKRGVLAGVLLMVATVVALAWANSPWSASYFHLWEFELAVGPTDRPVSHSLHEWINDGLMAVFFLLVGLEIKRELLVGELSSARQAALPIAAAIGGMLLPALIYAAVNIGGAGSRGWGIPMATDIAFALGVLTLLGPRVPPGLKVFLAALAIVDDMGAVAVIAIFYTSTIQTGALALAGLTMVLLFGLNRAQVRSLTPYLLLGLVLWGALLSSGIHATIAGVMLALAIPSRTRINAAEFSSEARALIDDFDRSETGDLLVLTSKGQQEALYALEVASTEVQAPLIRMEHALHGIVGYTIMPVFALANAGVVLSGIGEVMTDRIAIGVMLGLLLGKPGGVMLFSWLSVRLGLAGLPAGVSWGQLHGASWLAGIGFTMSLFVSGLAFSAEEMLTAAKLGVLAGSIVAGVVGWRLIVRANSRPGATPAKEPA